jgi:hypothetical protein
VYFLTNLAIACSKASHCEEGLAAIAEAVGLVEGTEERHYEAKLYQVKGELTLQQFSVESSRATIEQQAEGCFRKSIEIAQRQEARSFELSATISLCRLWQQHDRRPKPARCLPTSITGSPRASTLTDLRGVKALLNELSS